MVTWKLFEKVRNDFIENAQVYFSVFLDYWSAWVGLVAGLVGWALVKRCGVRPWPLPFTPSPVSVLFFTSFLFLLLLLLPFSVTALPSLQGSERSHFWHTGSLSVKIWSTSLTRIEQLWNNYFEGTITSGCAYPLQMKAWGAMGPPCHILPGWELR